MLMGFVKGKWENNLILKAWERCRSFGAGTGYSKRSHYNGHDDKKNKGQIIAPSGCFPVFVGTERQRFVVKTEFASHPLFRMLLEEAEMEYEFESDGPIWLPCTVDLFCKVLAEMGAGQEETSNIRNRRSFAKAKGCSSLVVLRRFLCYTNNSGHREYKVMDSAMLKMNQFR